MVDKIKLSLALLMLIVGTGGFYLFAEQAAVVRLLSVLLGVALAVGIAWKTELGQRAVVFAREAIVETRKVVWPTRKETVQMTGLVFAFAVVIAIFLWMTDKSLEWVLYHLILGRGK